MVCTTSNLQPLLDRVLHPDCTEGSGHVSYLSATAPRFHHRMGTVASAPLNNQSLVTGLIVYVILVAKLSILTILTYSSILLRIEKWMVAYCTHTMASWSTGTPTATLFQEKKESLHMYGTSLQSKLIQPSRVFFLPPTSPRRACSKKGTWRRRLFFLCLSGKGSGNTKL